MIDLPSKNGVAWPATPSWRDSEQSKIGFAESELMRLEHDKITNDWRQSVVDVS